jgi:hypothetical protein
MTETELIQWRDRERERLSSIHNSNAYELCMNTINVLSAVIQDD